MPQNSHFRLTRDHRFFPKNESYGYGAKSWWGPRRVHLGANGVPLGPKNWVKSVKNYHASKFAFSTTPRSSIFCKKWKLRLWCQITVGTPWGLSGGQWGPIGSKKWVKTAKNYHAPKVEFPTTPRSSIFPPKIEVTVMVPNHGGDFLGSILGPMEFHWDKKKWVQSVTNYQAQKFEFSTNPPSSIFPEKWKLRLWRQITVGTRGVYLWANGVPLGKKWVKTVKKLPCPKIRIFDYPAVIDFPQKMEVTVMAPNHGWDPVESLLGPMGSDWVKKNGSKPWKITMP